MSGLLVLAVVCLCTTLVSGSPFPRGLTLVYLCLVAILECSLAEVDG